MKSTKYQLLKDDFDSACRELRQYREIIEQQKEEIKQIEKVSDYNADMRMKYEKAEKKVLKIIKSSIPILVEVHTKTDNDLIEERVNEVIMDLEYLVKELES